MTPTQRPAHAGDAPTLLPLMAELCAGDSGLARVCVEAVLAAGPPGHEAWVLAGEAGLLGFIALSPSGAPHFHLGFVEWIAVAPAARRQGIGRQLLALGQTRALSLGWRQLHASTFHTNRPALHMYIDAGFYPAATLPDYGGPGLHYVELLWPVARCKGDA